MDGVIAEVPAAPVPARWCSLLSTTEEVFKL